MRKIKQGRKKPVVWKATCPECGSRFEEQVKKLKVTYEQRDGDFARSKCPDCHCEMFFYPPSSGSSSVWGDH